ncbi:hypothetical protein EVAR_90117_1 [Eumeta japonica]|uniref:Uncharacterized protein n=1 Tax=Eumeta variegata TaxID=151549 RepID=A0A4C1ZXJ6_EUMVA|nr:hypothetical protein EVAR_90117_1 [Eumeta japonica]
MKIEPGLKSRDETRNQNENRDQSQNVQFDRPPRDGRYRAPAPSALTKLFAFVQIAARDPPSPADRESNRWLPNGVNEVICSEPGAGLSPSGNGKPGRTWDHRPWRCSSPIPGVARPPSIIPHSILRTRLLAEHPIVCSHTCPSSSENSAGRPASSIVRPTNNRRLINTCATTGNCTIKRARLPWTKIPLLPWGGRVWPQNSITLEFIQQVLTKALSEIGYEAPQDVVARDQPEMDIDPSSAPTSMQTMQSPPRCGPTDSDYEYRLG